MRPGRFLPAFILHPRWAQSDSPRRKARKNYDVKIGRFPFAANGRALASGEGVGFIKVISEKKYGEIVGVHIIGPGAAEMVNEASLLMSMEVTDEENGRHHACAPPLFPKR